MWYSTEYVEVGYWRIETQINGTSFTNKYDVKMNDSSLVRFSLRPCYSVSVVTYLVIVITT